MELRYENLKDKPETFLAFTGLNRKEFQILLQAFTLAWELYVQQNSLPQDVVPPTNGRKEPAIAESRIQGYDGETVTFSYEDHETGEKKLETLPVLQFIGRLIMLHIRDTRW